MSGDLYRDIRISPNSPLLLSLKIQPGNYYAKYEASGGKLLLKRQGSAQILSLSVTPEQLIAILLTVQQQQDKFTPEELEIIDKIRREPRFSGSKKEPAHHIIPLEVCKRSKLVIQAKRCSGFDENDDINRLPLPAYFHKDRHQRYSNFVEDVLEGEWSDLVAAAQENDSEAIEQALRQVIDYLREKIDEMRATGVCSINDL
ncbi:MAG TPA: AHH domain-containing protein [Chroococcales cyanobacterium]|jgi:hypothetical protein